MRMQGYCDVYKWTILERTSPEVTCLHPTSSRREMCTLSVSNVIYHKFSHGAAFYTLNGKSVNVMLESGLMVSLAHKFLLAKHVQPSHNPRSMASEVGLRCLRMSPKPKTGFQSETGYLTDFQFSFTSRLRFEHERNFAELLFSGKVFQTKDLFTFFFTNSRYLIVIKILFYKFTI